MAKYQQRYSAYTIDIDQDWIDTTSSFPTPNERWTYTDKAGHEHRYERGYPTLTLVVDAEHWCDGTEGYALHDPHMAVDESHYECSTCGQVIEPKMDPPFTPKQVPGRVTGTIEGPRSDGAFVRAVLMPDELDECVEHSESPERLRALVDAIPLERIVSVEFSH